MSQRYGASIATPASRLVESNQNSNTFTLPQPITDAGRLSLARLPIDPNSTFNWQCFSIRDEKARLTQALDQDALQEDALLQESIHSLMQITQEQARSNPSYQSDFQSTLTKSALWFCQSKRRSRLSTTDPADQNEKAPRSRCTTAIWLFELDKANDSGTEQDASSSRNPSNESVFSVQKVKQSLLQSNLILREGFLKLKEIFSPLSSNGFRDQTSLLPAGKDKRQALKHLLAALEEYLLTKWVWDRHQQKTSSFIESRTQPYLQPDISTFQNMPNTQSKANAEDEEEGALDGEDSTQVNTNQSEAQSEPQANFLFWSDTIQARQRPIVRFGKGVMVYQRSASQQDKDSGLYSRNGDDCSPIHMTLRCFADDQGCLYVETWPRKMPVSRHVTKQDLGKEFSLILAPHMLMARMISYLGPIDTETDSQQVEDAVIAGSRDALFALLRMYAVDTSFLRNEWVKCSYQEHIFAWPAQLCLVQEELLHLPNAKMPSLFESTLTDVTVKARRFIRETLGLEMTPEPQTIASQDEEDEQMEEDEDFEQEGQTVEESTNNQVNTQINQSSSVDNKSAEIADEQAKTSGSATDMKKNNLGDNLILPISQNITRRNSTLAADSISGSKDEELDLWGSFGFVGQDDNQLQPPSRSRDGFDDPGFGMVTEDDFSFFDDGAGGFGDFIEEGALGEVEEEIVGGQEFADATMTDLVLEHDTTEGQEDIIDNSKVHSLRNGQDHEISSGATSSTMDPPSLPGFTPGSISESSPAVGGMNMKTPRTPYSPNQDLADTAVTIEGEYGSMENNSYGHHHFDHHQGLTQGHTDEATNGMQNHDTPMGPPDMRFSANNKKQQAWTIPARRDITSKYEQGKFAMPLHPARKRNADEVRVENTHRHESEPDRRNVPARNRLGHRTGINGKRLLFSQTGTTYNNAHAPFKGGRVGAIRADEEMSEATGDGTMSEHSSLMDEDSDDDDSFSSDDSSDEAEELLSQRQTMLKSSLDFLRGETFFDAYLALDTKSESFKTDKSCSTSLEPAEWNDIVSHLIDNPQLRFEISRKTNRAREMASFSRHDAQHLFTVMQGFEKDSSISTCFNNRIAKPETKRVSFVRPMEACNLLVGCQESVTNIAPSALGYWDKLGLAAVGGEKNISAFALHAGEVNDDMQNEIKIWMNALAKVYMDNGFGSHIMTDDGILDLGSGSHSSSLARTLNTIANDAEQWSDTVESLVSRIVGALKMHSCVVIYAIGRFDDAKSIESFVRLQRDLRTSASVHYMVQAESIVVRPCSWESIRSSISMARGSPSNALPKLAMSIYDSLQVSVDAQCNQEQHLPRFASTPIAVRFPAFSILPSSLGNGIGSDFRLDWNGKSLNILDCGTLLHVGYHLAPSAGKPSFLALMDERAQGYTATAWRRIGTIQEEIQRIWDLTVEFTLRARTKWRIVISKDEAIGIQEIGAWSKILEDKKNLDRANAMEVILTCSELQRAMAIIPPLLGQNEMEIKRQSALDSIVNSKNGGKYIDASTMKFAIYPQNRIPPRESSIVNEGEIDEEESESSPILPLRTSVIITIPQHWNFSTAATLDGSTEDQNDTNQTWSPNTPHLLWTHLLQIYTTSENVEEITSQADRINALSQVSTSQTATASNTPSGIINNAETDSVEAVGMETKLDWSNLDSRLQRITKSYQELELISRERAMLPLDDPTTAHLPWHLAILQSLNNLSHIVFAEN